MAAQQELQVQQKREVDKPQEPTRPMRAFVPTTEANLLKDYVAGRA